MSAPMDSAWERFLVFTLETNPSELATYSDTLRGCTLSIYLHAQLLTPTTPCVACSFQEVYVPKMSRLVHLCTYCLKAEFLLEDTWEEMPLSRFTQDLRSLCAQCADRVPHTESERLFKVKVCSQNRL